MLGIDVSEVTKPLKWFTKTHIPFNNMRGPPGMGKSIKGGSLKHRIFDVESINLGEAIKEVETEAEKKRKFYENALIWRPERFD